VRFHKLCRIELEVVVRPGVRRRHDGSKLKTCESCARKIDTAVSRLMDMATWHMFCITKICCGSWCREQRSKNNQGTCHERYCDDAIRIRMVRRQRQMNAAHAFGLKGCHDLCSMSRAFICAAQILQAVRCARCTTFRTSFWYKRHRER
jgi:hypothetical protein